MDSERHYDEDAQGFNEDFNPFDSTAEGLSTGGNRTPLEGLSYVDYSLNSPLISDEVEEFLFFLRGRLYRPLWNLKLWNTRKTY